MFSNIEKDVNHHKKYSRYCLYTTFEDWWTRTLYCGWCNS